MKKYTRIKLGLTNPAIIATGVIIFLVAMVPFFHIFMGIPVKEEDGKPIYDVNIGVGNVVLL